jgi:hypothetical protein
MARSIPRSSAASDVAVHALEAVARPGASDLLVDAGLK